MKFFNSGFSVTRNKTDIGAWMAFLFGVIVCVLAIVYIEARKEPSSLLTFEASSTQPGMLKVLYTKDGLLTDPGWAVNFSQGNANHVASFPLKAGQYELFGFKPLVEASGKVSIRNLRIISGPGVRNIGSGNFVAINQLNTISSHKNEIVIAPVLGANDPFGAFHGLSELVPTAPITLESFLWITAGKLALIAVFVALMYGMCGNLPFARGVQNEPRPEPGLSQCLGLLAVGLIVLYLRNAHSIFTPVLYAEDGTWSAGLINRGFFDMLFNARDRGDYFVFGNVLFLALAQLSNTVFFGHNLTYLPHFVSLFSMLFYAALAVAPIVLLRDVLRIEARLLLWLLVLLVPLGNSSYEVLGRLSNIGFAFLFLAFCLLIWRRYSLQEASRKQIIAIDAMLFLCANTNPLCYPLIAVAFGIEAWHHWNSNSRPRINFWLKKYQALFSTRSALALLMMLFLMGLWLILRQKMGSSSLDGKFILSNIPEAIIARTLLYPIIFPLYSHFNNMTSGVLLLIVVVVLALLAKDIQREKFTLVGAAVVLAGSAAIIIVSRPVLTEILDHYRTTFPDRYYYGLTLFVYLVLASALSASFGADKKSWRRIGANTLVGGLIALYAGNSAILFEFSKPRIGYLPEASFMDEVKKAYENGGEGGPGGMRYKVALHPVPWFTYFPADYVTATVFGARLQPFAITTPQSKAPVQSAATRSYDGKVVRQKPAGRGREDGWFYVSDGVRSWIPDGNWLIQENLSPADVIEITSSEFAAIPDSGEAVK